MTCRLCLQNREEFKRRYYNTPRCGFEDGVFNSANEWNCQTLIELRELAEIWGFSLRDDHIGTIFVLPFDCIDLPGEEFSRAGWLVLGCYKNRGHTEFALVIYPEGVVGEAARVEPLKIELAEAILKQYRGDRNDS